MPVEQPKALLFDLGGVVLDVDFRRAIQVWQPHSRLSPEEVRKRFAFDEMYERHERGEVAAQAYFQHVGEVLLLDCDPSVVARGWNSIYAGEILETVELLELVRQQIPCYAFTNTNAAHMSAWTQMFPRVAGGFDRVFASHELGLRKPEPEAFTHVAGAIGVSAASILFFDDLPENVEQAKASGFQTVLVRSPGDVREALVRIGCAI